MEEHKRASKAFQRSEKLVLRDIPLWKDTIPKKLLSGSETDYISAGWLLSKMDLAGGKTAFNYVRGRAVTVAIDSMSFPKPVQVGDTVSFYADVIEQGRSSLTIRIESWAERRESKKWEKVTEGVFSFVAIDDHGKPVPITTPPAKGVITKGKGNGKAAPASHTPPDSQYLIHSKLATEADRNYNKDIFGGWLLDQMDVCGLKGMSKYTGKLGATRGIEAMVFRKPVNAGERVDFYAEHVKTGNTSVTIKIEAWARRKNGAQEKVTEGLFTYVALDHDRKPVPISSPNL